MEEDLYSTLNNLSGQSYCLRDSFGKKEYTRAKHPARIGAENEVPE